MIDPNRMISTLTSRPTPVRFGIVIPAFQASSTLPSTLDAVADQTLPPTSVVVVVDGPDPDLERIVVEHRLDCDVMVLPENTGAPCTPRNVGAASLRARPDIDAIWFLDNDDIPAPEFLAIMDETLGSHPEAMFACSSFRNWNDASPREVGETRSAARTVSTELEVDWYLANTGEVLPSFSVFRIAALDLLERNGGLFRPELPSNQDYDVFVRLFHLVEARRVEWRGGDYRIHAASISADRARSWSCRVRADLMLADWFASRSQESIAREFRKRSRSAARRAARERWHAGARNSAARELLHQAVVGPDFKAVAVLARLACGLERPSIRGGG